MKPKFGEPAPRNFFKERVLSPEESARWAVSEETMREIEAIEVSAARAFSLRAMLTGDSASERTRAETPTQGTIPGRARMAESL
jgi:hypothetical protein